MVDDVQYGGGTSSVWRRYIIITVKGVQYRTTKTV